jgi:hypothetical protein
MNKYKARSKLIDRRIIQINRRLNQLTLRQETLIKQMVKLGTMLKRLEEK